ncbi:MAG: DEAD/DEAH box helicase [Candidatus Syntrophoarchaeum sp. WYZ-LMO15]|nr:MAG: DEAD/DEAH box helicase [Candidatus Syntrophoarchaeum sp. WYZ-LMO15]
MNGGCVFELLDPRIRKILDESGIKESSPPQTAAIPQILAGKDLLLIAPTGSGKTEAAILPIFHKILHKRERKGISAIYVTPLRALNRDMLKRLHGWGRELGISIEVRHGDTSQAQRRRQALHPPDLIITTPETLQLLLVGRKMRRHLSGVSWLIVDEVHELADSKRGLQLAITLERLREVAGDFQRIGLSATVGNPKDIAAFLAGVDRDVEVVDISSVRSMDIEVSSPAPHGEDFEISKSILAEPEIASHIRRIRDLVSSHRSTLIFVNTRQSAEALSYRLRLISDPGLIGVHHGSLSKEARIEVEDQFKQGSVKGLICTSSMELGIDVGTVDLVIQYMSPREVTRLIQRVGRSGHSIDRVSKGIIIASDPDEILESWVIAKMAREGKAEDIRIREGALDVVANQICGMLLEYERMDEEGIYSIIKRAYPFRNLSHEDLREVIDELSSHGLIWCDEKGITRRGKGRSYYYENLSMIPDERRYEIYDIVSRRRVGMLDEAFVVNFARVGAVFVTKGEMWRIVGVEAGRLDVEPVRDPEGEVPSWVGEEIPVPYTVAQEVGRMRGQIADMIRSGLSDAEIHREILKICDTDLDAVCKVTELLRRQIREGHPVPDDKTVLVELEKDHVVINVALGHRANDALGRIITSFIAAKFGSSIPLEIDPYRIKFKTPAPITRSYLEQVINSIKPEFVEPILKMTLKNTILMRWKMVNVAKKFGAIKKDADYSKIPINRLYELFHDTPIEKEAIWDIFHENLDLDRCKEFLRDLTGGKIKIFFSGLTPVGLSGYGGRKDLLTSKRVDRSILLALKRRIMNDHVILFCTTCKNWRVKMMVKEVKDPIKCPICSSGMIAALKPWEDEEIKLVKRKDKLKSKEDKARVKRVYRNANLVLSHGKKAVVALASRGVGPEIASRIISKLRDDEMEFYRDIMEAERKYAATRGFWRD